MYEFFVNVSALFYIFFEVFLLVTYRFCQKKIAPTAFGGRGDIDAKD